MPAKRLVLSFSRCLVLSCLVLWWLLLRCWYWQPGRAVETCEPGLQVRTLVWECTKCATTMSYGELLSMCPGCLSCGAGCGGARHEVGVDVSDGRRVPRKHRATQSAKPAKPGHDDDKIFGPSDRRKTQIMWTHCHRHDYRQAWRACKFVRRVTSKASIYFFEGKGKGSRRLMRKLDIGTIPYNPTLCGHAVATRASDQGDAPATTPVDDHIHDSGAAGEAQIPDSPGLGCRSSFPIVRRS
jgi:hypothetical protein